MKQDKITLLILLLFCVQILNAQIGTGGKPYSFQKSYLQLTKVPIELMPHKDNAILLEQEQPASKEDGYIFGEIINVKYTPNNSGLWEDLSNGDRLWRLAIKSKGAYSLNLVFDKFYMPIHSYMYIYTADKSYVTGAFTTNNNNENRSFATDIYPSDEIVIEYYESKYDRDSTFIELSKIVHAYKDMFHKAGIYGSSDDCQIDVNCSQGKNYQDIKRAVVEILYINYAYCTGTLLNNTAQDGRPLLLTANHCIEGRDPSKFVFVFNYETEDCNSSKSKERKSINGAKLLAKDSPSDFCLLEMNDKPTAEMNPFYAGWNANWEVPTSALCIHHPSGDLKKISTVFGNIDVTDFDDNEDGVTHLRFSWTEGSTEGGSSGAALFNQNKLVVGQLEGGWADCNIPEGEDYYGRLAYSWTNKNADTNKRLNYWLAPTNSGKKTLQGYNPYNSENIQEKMDISIYITPNVAKDWVRVNGLEEFSAFQYQIFSTNGAMVLEGNNTNGDNLLNVSCLKNGLYFLCIQNDKDLYSLKLIICK